MADSRQTKRADERLPISDEQDEARRIIERVQNEAAASGTIVQRGLSRTARHLSAQDVNDADAVEVWSTRIGRMLGFIITLAIIVWLVTYLLQG